MNRPGPAGAAVVLICLSVTLAFGVQDERGEEFRIRIAVEEIRLDAVVVDGNGRQITDLKLETTRYSSWSETKSAGGTKASPRKA